MKTEQVNQKLADIRSEADAMYKAGDNLRKDAARLYGRADKIWAARIAIEVYRNELLKIGYPYEPDAINERAAAALEKLINGGHLG